MYDKKYDIIKIVVFNGLMLLFGYLGETGIISKYIGIPLGFLFFGPSENMYNLNLDNPSHFSKEFNDRST